MPSPPPIAAEKYFQLQQACRDAVHRGDVSRAKDLARRASVVARHADRPDLLHLAVTNQAMVLLELGELAQAEKGLREVVLGSDDDLIICRAAFYLASSLRRQGRMTRALFFARQATERAARIDDRTWDARCHNLLGNIHLNQNRLATALRCYRRALAIWATEPGDHRFARAIVLDNIGYCLILDKRLQPGIRFLKRALALALEISDRRTEAECRQDLAHAFLSAKAVPEARGNALAALRIAEAAGYRDILQNCFYLLGELAALEGDREERDAYFAQLQACYPDFPYLRDFLRMFDLTNILTFH